jgi:hypothetical protein
MVLTVVVMALVELAQGAIVAGRAFDVDDVILNTTGALIGYVLLGRRLGRAWRRRRGEAEQPDEPVASSSRWRLSRRRRPAPPRP